MKYLIFGFILFASFSKAYSQRDTISLKKTGDVPFKNAEIIIIVSDTPDSEAFKIAGQALITSGFSIAQSDANFFSIVTTKDYVRNSGFELVMRVSIVKGAMIIRCSGYSGRFTFPASYHPKFKQVPSETFRIMNEYAVSVAKSLSDAKITYAIE